MNTSKQPSKHTLGIVAIGLGTIVAMYLIIAFMTAMFNAGNLEYACTKNGGTWIANPLMLGTTGACR